MTTSGGGASRALSIVPGDVRDIGNYVYSLVDTLQGALDAAAREVDALTSNGWTGGASDGFLAGWNDVRDGGATMVLALVGMAEKLGVTADTYERRDVAHADRLAGSSLDLP